MPVRQHLGLSSRDFQRRRSQLDQLCITRTARLPPLTVTPLLRTPCAATSACASFLSKGSSNTITLLKRSFPFAPRPAEVPLSPGSQ